MSLNKYYLFGLSAINLLLDMEENYSEKQIADKMLNDVTLCFEVLEFDMDDPNPDLLLSAYDGWMAHHTITEELFKLLKND